MRLDSLKVLYGLKNCICRKEMKQLITERQQYKAIRIFLASLVGKHGYYLDGR